MPGLPEYGRTWSEIRPGGFQAPWHTTEFDLIAQTQCRLEDDAARRSPRPLLVADTDAFATTMWNERPHLGGRKTFGFQIDGIRHEPAEAEAVRAAAQWLLDGVSLREVARRWNAAGIRTATGREWAGELVSQLMRSPRRRRSRCTTGSR